MQTEYRQAIDLMDALDAVDAKTDGPRNVNRYRLAKRMLRRQQRDGGRVLPIFIAVQSTSRHYGGPEEGGWYYNWTETDEVFRFWDWRSALQKMRELHDEYDQPRFGIYSAANRGEAEFHFVLCSDPSFFESRETQERPTYC